MAHARIVITGMGAVTPVVIGVPAYWNSLRDGEHPMLAAYKRPRYYRFVDDLPYTATGKKKHYEVKKRAAEDGKQGLLERP